MKYALFGTFKILGDNCDSAYDYIFTRVVTSRVGIDLIKRDAAEKFGVTYEDLVFCESV